jgi:Hypervirulence associated proteins TUDOR domain
MARKTAAQKLKKGDKVSWNTSQGPTSGTVKKKLTAPARIKDHRVAASPANPEFLVESDRSGAQAAHKPGSLKKAGRCS